jgi:hypothetical protein
VEHSSNNVHNVLFAPTLQQLHQSLNPEASNVLIAWWLLAFGLIQLVLSQIPTMHHLRHLNAVATAMTAVWTVMVAAECFRTGVRHSPPLVLSYVCSSRAACSAQQLRQYIMPVTIASCTDERLPVDREWSCVVAAAGQAMRKAGVHVSYAPPAGSPGAKARGAFEATGIFTFAIANMLLPEVPPSTQPDACLMLTERTTCIIWTEAGLPCDANSITGHACVMPRRSSPLSSPRRCLMAGRASTWGSCLSTLRIRSSASRDTGCGLHPNLPTLLLTLLLPRANQPALVRS